MVVINILKCPCKNYKTSCQRDIKWGKEKGTAAAEITTCFEVLVWHLKYINQAIVKGDLVVWYTNHPIVAHCKNHDRLDKLSDKQD